MLPHYLDQPGALYRWERFPLRVSIDRASSSMLGAALPVYEKGLRDGAAVWSLASGGVIGSLTIDFDLSQPDLVVRFDVPDDDRRLLGVEGEFQWGPIDGGRFLRSGMIRLFPEIIRGTRIGELPDYIANLMAHEMGHALGVQKHSPESTDLMYQLPPRNFTNTSYPWVTQRDLNTLLGAYCQ